jgi:hypothetical protein
MVLSKDKILGLMKRGQWPKAGEETLNLPEGEIRDSLLKSMVKHCLAKNLFQPAIDYAEKFFDHDKRDLIFAEIIVSSLKNLEHFPSVRILTMVPKKDRVYLRKSVFKEAEKQSGAPKWLQACFLIKVEGKLSKKDRQWCHEMVSELFDEEILKLMRFAFQLDGLFKPIRPKK